MVRIHTQFELAKSYQMFESLRLVVSEALGGSTASTTTEAPEGIQTYEELAQAFAALGGKVNG